MVLSTAVTETKFAEQFRRCVEGEPDPALRSLRKEAFDEFTEIGFPSARLEDWKYTNVAPIAALDWRASGGHGVEIDPADLDHLRRFATQRNGFTALNMAFGAFLVLRIARETVIEEPIAMDLLEPHDGEAVFPHLVIIAEAGSKATIVESYASATRSLTNSALQIFVEDNASLTHYRVQKDAVEAFHYGVTEVELGRDSRYDLTSINLGGALSRHDIELKFTAEGAEAWVDGLYMLNESQHHDTHSVIDHAVPNCISHQTYRGVLNDSSRGVFNGKVFVRGNAHGTDAQQQNKNLLLSNDARVDTKPQLEIFNDDVKCSHGATVGQLEEEELFYLRTRGLSDELARNLLTYGFAEEIINKIAVGSIKTELDSLVLNRLKATI